MPDSVNTQNEVALTTPNAPVVIVKDGVPVADSRNVSGAFGKRHKHVLEKIDALLVEAPELHGTNFRPMIVEVQIGNGAIRQDRAFEMDEIGFSLIAMRFTGSKALQWQIAYANEFQRMRDAINAGSGSAMVESFGPAARSTLGGIMKRVTHAELQEAFGQALPALVEPMLERMVAERLMSDRLKIVHGVSALQVAEMAGYGRGRRPRGMTQYITHRVGRYHEDRRVLTDRSPHGSARVRIYNEALTRRWLMEGGQTEIDHYAAQRKGQGALKLVRS
jgi:Rha family phage regulatory protein